MSNIVTVTFNFDLDDMGEWTNRKFSEKEIVRLKRWLHNCDDIIIYQLRDYIREGALDEETKREEEKLNSTISK